MGNYLSQPINSLDNPSQEVLYSSEQELVNNIVFIQNRDISNQQLGLDTVQIYRFKEPPYEYVMKHTKIFHQSCIQSKQYLNTLVALTKISHRNIAQIFYIKNQIKNSMCLRSISIQNYSSFYALQLRQIIYQRKIKDYRFEESEIYYILKSMLSIGSFLKKMELCFGLFQSKNMYISSEGYLKAYLYHIKLNNMYFGYNQMLYQKPSNWFKFIPFAPQFIQNIKQNISSPLNLNPYQSDIFCIGMIIIQMIMDNQLARYYKIDQHKSLKFYHSKLIEDLKNLKNIYSDTFLKLIQNLTNPSPEERWDYEQAEHYLKQNKQFFTIGCSLKMFQQQQEEQQTKIKVSYKSNFSKSQNILRSIQTSLQNKLTVVPIKSLYNQNRREEYNFNQSSCKKTIYTRRSSHCGMEVVSKNKNCENKIKIRNQRSSNASYNNLNKNTSFRSQLVVEYPQKSSNYNTLTLGNTRITQNQKLSFEAYSNYGKKSQKLRIYQNYMSNQIQSSRTSITPIKELKNLKNNKSNHGKLNIGINLKSNSSKSRIVLR